MRCTLLFLFAILVSVTQAAGQAQPRFERSTVIDKKKGLPTNYIIAVEKDKQGFMWLGTAEGLCRFDGTHIKIYKHDPNDSTSLFDNSVYAVKSYRGKIWAATGMGISVLDPETERFKHYQLDGHGMSRPPRREPRRELQVLYIDPRGELWVGSQFFGMAKYLPEKDDFQYFPLRDTVALNRYAAGNRGALRILSITASTTNDSIIYAGTPAGLQEVNRYTGLVRWLYFPMTPRELELGANAFRRLYCHDDGRLYCGSWRAGVHVFDPGSRTFLPLSVKKGPGSELLSYVIRGICRKSAEEIWITTITGLVLYNTRRQEVTFYKKNDIPDGRFYGIDYIDDANRVWLTAFNGLHVFDPGLQLFQVYSYEKLHPPDWSYTYYLCPGATSDELLVVSRNDAGIYHFDLSARSWQRFLPKIPGAYLPEKWAAKGLARAPDGTYTISTEQGLFSYDAIRHEVSPFPFQPPIPLLFYGEVIWDRQGRLWMSATSEGLICWNPKTKTHRVYKQELLPPGATPALLVVMDVYEDRRGQVWIRREDGISVFLPQRDTVLNFLYSINPKNTFSAAEGFAEDRMGRIWVCDRDGWIGYAEIDRPEAGLVKKINLRVSHGITDIYDLAVDGAGNIWGYSLKELLYIQVEGDIRVSTLSFDYSQADPDFYSFKYLSNGEFVFGGRNEIVLFDPQTLYRNTEQPQPYIEYIRIQGKQLPAIPHVNGKPVLHLQFWENFFSIDFSAKAYTLGDKCRFRYRLRDFEEWQEAGERRHANYTNVPGGEYVFEVQVANNEGVWSDVLLEMPVWVETAWWATWWFRMLVVLATLAAVYGIYHYRVLQIRRQERLRTEFEKKLANVEMSALLAQMNPHFLFNSLNSIDSYIIRNESKKASEYLNNFARLIRLILNNSRSNYISLKDELEALELYLQMESLRFRDKFQYEIIVDGTLDVASINIPPMLIQPYIENAIWHGLMYKESGPGIVTLRVEHKNDCLMITVQDNGVGRAKAMELGARHARKKTQSVGMKITEDRIEIINKLYDANTKVDVFDLYDDAGAPAGTKVVLTVPI
ncbi:MAG: histidine kinase [Thermoanaerobaculia bacterium]|nr:histidine kinase [Thermoanaerobaculia bacterium]